MSFNVASEDFWDAETTRSVRLRCKSMFNNKLLSDVTFVVRDGCEKIQKIPAHKFLLAISSPVFFAMFYGELAEKKDSIKISDCEYDSLLELFRFMYSDEVNLNPDNVLEVLYLAKKYLLPTLADKCTGYIQQNLDGSNVFHVLSIAEKYDEKDLMYHCWEVIEKRADEAVKSDDFVTIERSVLEELVERDSLNVKEVELFKAVDCWATKECEKQGLAAEGSVKRRILGDRIVKAIRYPVMEEKEFAKFVLDSDILTKKESVDLMKYFNHVLDFPVGFSEAKRAGFVHRMFRFGSGKKLKGCGYPYGWSDSIKLTVDKNIKLHSVRLFGSENNEYSVTLKVTDEKGLVLATKRGKFLSKLVQSTKGDYHCFNVAFEPPLALQPHIAYCFQAFISGPNSWYGRGGLFCVKHSGVEFFFSEAQNSRGRSKVTEGQFSGFDFTVS
ncbi:hypothetical protein ACROYT_G022019 [Oculina patagonica]